MMLFYSMPASVRFTLICLHTAVLLCSLVAGRAGAQCIGIPSVSALGSNKFPVGLCGPVTANITYNVTFTSPTPSGKLELVYDWGDGSPFEIIPISSGLTSYSTSRNHDFPIDSDCEFYVTIAIHYNGIACSATRQMQKIASWRTDDFNGGNVKLISPLTKTREHLVCEGQPLDVIFSDETNWNCNPLYSANASDLIETPNTENRWQQIIYNTTVTGSKIPNVHVDGIPVTGSHGVDRLRNYSDPRGIFYMSSPVLLNDARRRPTLRITAAGGFFPDAPKANDVFEITLRYWNYCNPYDDPAIPGPPEDLINGDHPPTEEVAIIKIVPAPEAPVAVEKVACNGSVPEAFEITDVPDNSICNWYTDEYGFPGDLIRSGTTTSLPVSSHPDWINKTTPKVYKVWASYVPTGVSSLSCESNKTLITRTIREAISIPEPITGVPDEICNNSSFILELPPSAFEPVGGQTRYKWKGSNGVTVDNPTSSFVTVNVKVDDKEFDKKLFVKRTVTVAREYTSAPLCSKSKVFTITVYRMPRGGILSTLSDVCETTDAGILTLTQYSGEVTRWEISEDNNAYSTYHNTSDTSIALGKIKPGTYFFRAVVSNRHCREVYSHIEQINVFANPSKAFAGDDQFICTSLKSSPMSGSDPFPGTGSWTVVNTIPEGLPFPEFSDVTDPDASIKINEGNAGAYVLRWTVENGTCSSSDDVIIDFGTTPTDPTAGEDRNVCGATTQLNGNSPQKGLAQWTVVSGENGCVGSGCPVSILNPSSPNTDVKLANENSAYGTYTFRWTISSGGNNCFTKTDDVKISFTRAVNVIANDVTNVCLDSQNPKPIKINGIVTGNNITGLWTNVSGSGTLSAQRINGKEIIDVQAEYLPSIADYTNGLPIQLKLTAQSTANNVCSPVSKTINIYFDRKPVAEVREDVLFFCASEVQLNAEAPPHNAKGRWSCSGPTVMFGDSTDPNTIVKNIPQPPSETVVTWTVTSENGSCVSTPVNVTLKNELLPEAMDFMPVLCETSDFKTEVVLKHYEEHVTTAPLEERDITWFSGPDHATIIANPNEAFTASDNEVFIARIKSKRTACVSDAKVTIKVRRLPVVNDSTIELCEDVAGTGIVSAVDLSTLAYRESITSQQNTTVSWYHTPEDAFRDVSRITGQLNVHGNKNVYARVAFNDTDPHCFQVATLHLKTKKRPASIAIQGPEAVCQRDGSINSNNMYVEIYQVVPVDRAKYHWEIPDMPGLEFKVFAGAKTNDFYALLQFPNVVTGKISLVMEVDGCFSNVIEKEITVSQAPVQPTIVGTDLLCGAGENVSFSVSPNNYPSSAYNWEVRRASDNTQGGGLVVEGQSTGNVLINVSEDVILMVRESNSVCASSVATKSLVLSNPAKATITRSNEITCFEASNGSITTEVEGGTGSYIRYELFPGNFIDDDSNGEFQNLTAGTYRVKVTDSKGCSTQSNQITLKEPSPVVIDKIKVVADESGFELSAHNAADGVITVAFSGGNSDDDYTVSLVHLPTGKTFHSQGRGEATFDFLSHGTYVVSVADANGCTSSQGMVTIKNPPALSPGIIGFDQEVCSGEDPKIIDELSPAYGGTGIYEYQWQVSPIADAIDESSWQNIEGETHRTYNPPAVVIHSNTAQVQYYRRLVYSKSKRAEIFEVKGKERFIKITVHPLPIVTLASSGEFVCEGESIQVDINLTRGSVPVEFEYATGSVTGYHTGTGQTTIRLFNLTLDSTFSLLRVTDRNGCLANTLPEPVTVKVQKSTTNFTVMSSTEHCTSLREFKWDVEPGTEYRWEWGDGTIDVIERGTISEGEHTIRHVFKGNSAYLERNFRVTLFSKRGTCPETFVTQTVTIQAAIKLKITATDTLLCSGESVSLRDESVGVAKGVWFYRSSDVSERLSEQAIGSKEVSFSLYNTTEQNPVTYEIVYEAYTKNNCQAIYIQPVSVFKSPDVDFEAQITKPFLNGFAQVTLKNTSASSQTGYYNYQWSFGEASLLNHTHEKSVIVDYYSTGTKTIKLTAENIAASQHGKSCSNSEHRTIGIQPLVLNAAFEATPRAGCFPLDVTTTNRSTGADSYHWTLLNAKGIVSHSNLSDPTFQIVSPGVYTLRLIARQSTSGFVDSAYVEQIEVYHLPTAAFTVRDQVYSATKIIIRNDSQNAMGYSWQFGEGESMDSFEPSYVYQTAGGHVIKLIASNNYGEKDFDGDGILDGPLVCFDSAEHHIRVHKGGAIKVPNAFTPSPYGPNGGVESAGVNDVFLPQLEGAVEFRMEIFDRWGSVIFISTNKDVGWDGYNKHGTLMPAGVYVFKLSVRLSDGHQLTKIGDVTLIR